MRTNGGPPPVRTPPVRLAAPWPCWPGSAPGMADNRLPGSPRLAPGVVIFAG